MYFKKVADRDPNYAEVYYELGFCYENTAQLDKALDAYDKFWIWILIMQTAGIIEV